MTDDMTKLLELISSGKRVKLDVVKQYGTYLALAISYGGLKLQRQNTEALIKIEQHMADLCKLAKSSS